MPYLSDKQRQILDSYSSDARRQCEDTLECMDMWGEVTQSTVHIVFEDFLYELEREQDGNKNRTIV